MNNLLVLPIIIPLATAIITLLLRDERAQRMVSVAGAGLGLVVALLLLDSVRRSGIQVLQLGNWAAPFGIVLVADLLGVIMIVLGALMGLAVAVYALAGIDSAREQAGYHPLYHVLLMGVAIAFLTGDLFNLYVAFEVMLMASFVLLALGGERGQIEGAVKYMTLNLVSSALFLIAAGLTYGIAGTLNLADLAQQLPQAQPGLVMVVAMLLLVAFGIKAAVFPLFFWLPASYHTPPAAVSAIFAGLLTKVGVYALVRVFTLLFTQETMFTHAILLAIAGLTMIIGVLGAASQMDVRRILSFHIVSQIGYMIMGLALFTPLALAGIPPLSGFWAKYILVEAGLETGQWLIVAVALATGLLTLYSMTKIWAEVFWKAVPAPAVAVAGGSAMLATGGPSERAPLPMLLPIAVLALLTIVIGLAAEPMFNLAEQTALQLLTPDLYVQAVLNR